MVIKNCDHCGQQAEQTRDATSFCLQKHQICRGCFEEVDPKMQLLGQCFCGQEQPQGPRAVGGNSGPGDEPSIKMPIDFTSTK